MIHNQIVFESLGREPFEGAFDTFTDGTYFRLRFAGLNDVGSAAAPADAVDAAVDSGVVTVTMGPAFSPGLERFTIDLD